MFLSQSERDNFCIIRLLDLFLRGVVAFLSESGLGLSNPVVAIGVISVSVPLVLFAVVGELLGLKKERGVCSTRYWLRYCAVREPIPLYRSSRFIALLRQLSHISYSSFVTVGNLNLNLSRTVRNVQAKLVGWRPVVQKGSKYTQHTYLNPECQEFKNKGEVRKRTLRWMCIVTVQCRLDRHMEGRRHNGMGQPYARARHRQRSTTRSERIFREFSR